MIETTTVSYLIYGVDLIDNQIDNFNVDNPIHLDLAKEDPENPSYLSYCSCAGDKGKVGVLKYSSADRFALFFHNRIFASFDCVLLENKYIKKPRSAEKYIKAYLNKYNLKAAGEIGWLLCSYYHEYNLEQNA
jgi:hypothetical protein